MVSNAADILHHKQQTVKYDKYKFKVSFFLKRSMQWQTYSLVHHLDFSVKYPATLQLMSEDCSYNNVHQKQMPSVRYYPC